MSTKRNRWLAGGFVLVLVALVLVSTSKGAADKRAERDSMRTAFYHQILPMMTRCIDAAVTAYIARTGEEAPYAYDAFEEAIQYNYLPRCAKRAGLPAGFGCDWLACSADLNNGDKLAQVWAGAYYTWAANDPRYHYTLN